MQIVVIQKKIYMMRGFKVMLDKDLAVLYRVPTKSLNLAVKRNSKRFPKDFMFRLTWKEIENLRLQFETSSWGGSRYQPYAFTELGVSMLSSILNSPRAIQMNISIMRAFAALRKFALDYKNLAEKIAKLEKKYNKRFIDVNEVLKLLVTEKLIAKDWKDRERIGFKK